MCTKKQKYDIVKITSDPSDKPYSDEDLLRFAKQLMKEGFIKREQDFNNKDWTFTYNYTILSIMEHQD
jgi:hypothetical protein